MNLANVVTGATYPVITFNNNGPVTPVATWLLVTFRPYQQTRSPQERLTRMSLATRASPKRCLRITRLRTSKRINRPLLQKITSASLSGIHGAVAHVELQLLDARGLRALVQ